MIDEATLTGAIKVGLGSQIAGFFANDEKWSEKIEKASHASCDRMWRMPLFKEYKTAFKSTVADLQNAANGFGGAVRAALFLEEFVNERPWVHMDIYAWKDSRDGACLEAGGSGQGTQCLIEFVKEL